MSWLLLMTGFFVHFLVLDFLIWYLRILHFYSTTLGGCRGRLLCGSLLNSLFLNNLLSWFFLRFFGWRLLWCWRLWFLLSPTTFLWHVASRSWLRYRLLFPPRLFSGTTARLYSLPLYLWFSTCGILRASSCNSPRPLFLLLAFRRWTTTILSLDTLSHSPVVATCDLLLFHQQCIPTLKQIVATGTGPWMAIVL